MATGSPTVTVKLHDKARHTDNARIKRLPFTVENVVLPEGVGYDFQWDGATAYLALHDIVLKDGAMAGDGIAEVRDLDLRHKMTFLPRGARVKGWSEPGSRSNSFTALYFDEDWLLDELEVAPNQRTLDPLVYFRSKPLEQSMEQLARLSRARGPTPRLMADSLAFMAGAELMRALASKAPAASSLTLKQLNSVRDYVNANLVEDISLADLADAIGLSVFHFSRLFKKATGTTPYKYVIEARVERAKELMRDKSTALSVVAQLSGFSSASQFSRSFAEIVGVTPTEYRQRRR